MQGNITVLDIQKFYDNSALIKGRKPAKLSTFNNVYKKYWVAWASIISVYIFS